MSQQMMKMGKRAPKAFTKLEKRASRAATRPLAFTRAVSMRMCIAVSLSNQTTSALRMRKRKVSMFAGGAAAVSGMSRPNTNDSGSGLRKKSATCDSCPNRPAKSNDTTTSNDREAFLNNIQRRWSVPAMGNLASGKLATWAEKVLTKQGPGAPPSDIRGPKAYDGTYLLRQSRESAMLEPSLARTSTDDASDQDRRKTVTFAREDDVMAITPRDQSDCPSRRPGARRVRRKRRHTGTGTSASGSSDAETEEGDSPSVPDGEDEPRVAKEGETPMRRDHRLGPDKANPAAASTEDSEQEPPLPNLLQRLASLPSKIGSSWPDHWAH